MALAQGTGGNGVPGQSIGTGNYTLGSTPLVSGTPTTTIAGLAQLQNVFYLSSASEIGAQCNSAVTALGSTGGVIQLPNSTSLTMTTACTNIPPQISITGYGKNATIITCTVAGDCFQFTMNPTTVGSIASGVSSFEIDGSGASNQVLMHFNGASGYTLHDLQFEPYGGSGNAATCLEFDNSATGLFTERNRSYSVNLERQCTTGVLFNQNSGDSSYSFGYNNFEFQLAAEGSNYGIVFNGNGILYGGSLTVYCNHIGPGGGCVQFNNAFNANGISGAPGERLFITAEEDGSGAGTVLAATGTNSLNFDGIIFNGSSSATALATNTSVAGGATLYISNQYGVQGSNGTAQSGVAVDTNYNTVAGATPRSFLCPNIGDGAWCETLVGTGTGTGNAATLQFFNEGNNNSGSRGILGMPGNSAIEWDNAGNAYVTGGNLILGNTTYATIQMVGPHTWYDEISSTGQYILFDVTSNTTPFYITTAGSPYNNAFAVGANSIFGWSSQAQYANNAAADTAFSRSAANVVACGDGTQGDFSCRLKLAAITLAGGTSPTITGCGTISAQAGGATAGTFTTSLAGTCTAVIPLPTVAHGYICNVMDQTSHTVLPQSANSTASCTVTGTTAASDVLVFSALGW
jgi:hypothetical protein